MNIEQLQNQHLWWRAGFGPSLAQASDPGKQKPRATFDAILKSSENRPEFFDLADPALKEMMGHGTMAMMRLPGFKPEEKQMIRKQSVQDIAALNVRWLREMTESTAQLREKMALFWHGHFATKTVNILFDQALLNIIREHALGNFRDLLFNVSKSASMIHFLNNNQNKKGHPNENFARELMELFTIGRGNYSETDIKESARAFTGWSTSPQGEFEFRPRQHDGGVKTFFGKTGNLTGEDILDILLSQKQTAIFITGKIYRFFVNDKIDGEIEKELASEFFESGYDIRSLMISIFTSSWFYNKKNIGTQIKSPVVWLVGMRRQLPMEIGDPMVQLVLERLLGQVLFAPPNVAGWPGGKNWINSSSLMLRLQIPHIISQSTQIPAIPKEDDDQMMGMRNETLAKNIKSLRNPGIQFFRAEIFWKEYLKNFFKIPDKSIYEAICDFLLQKTLPLNESGMIMYADETNRDLKIRSLTIRIMGTPEYQLC